MSATDFDAWYEVEGERFDGVGEAFGAWLSERSGQTIVGGPKGEPPTFVAAPPSPEQERNSE